MLIINLLTIFGCRSTQSDPELLNTKDNDSLYSSRFNPKHPTKIIIHGFQGGRNLAPSTDLRKGMPSGVNTIFCAIYVIFILHYLPISTIFITNGIIKL